MELAVRLPSTGGRRAASHKIEAKSVSYEMPAKSGMLDCLHWYRVHADSRPILRDVSCEARPGEVLAIVGPSGAGKTTLLSILAGMIHPSRVGGDVLVNGCRMDASLFRSLSGYVTQDDALFPLLTVRESLMYSARLRLGAAPETTAARVNELLEELGLDHVAGSRVGSHGGSGISGGEKRRVSIGVDLVHDPAILLLDEPTSGLDSASALHIVAMLKTMAKVHGKTVVLTIHQPGYRILELFDGVLLLAGGTVRHHGTLRQLEKRLEDGGHLIPRHVNVLEYAMDTITTGVDMDAAPAVGSGADTEMASVVVAGSAAGAAYKEEISVVHANSLAGEVIILGERFFANIIRTHQLFAAKMIQSLLAGLGLGSIFMNVDDVQSRVGFFAFTLTFLLSSTTEGLPVFLQERRILMRETSRGAYRLSSYVIANALVFLPFLLVVSLLYAVPVYWMVGLRRQMDGFVYFTVVVWLVVVMANSFVVCFSALVPNFIMGNSLIAGLIGAFFLFSGYFIAKDYIPTYWIFMYYLSLFRYPFEAFMINEYGGEWGRRLCVQRQGAACLQSGEMFLRQQSLEDYQKWTSLGWMLGFICFYRILCLVILWLRCRRMSMRR